ncbi:hypothetical protein I4U23_030165 [Adineta vaga]|nr:hypothetical protein I4U23_030165 [Adineta vaga]
MTIIFAYLCQLILTILAIENDDLLLNGAEFPSSMYISLDKSYLLECNSKNDVVYWKVYLINGKIEIIDDKLIRLNEFDKNRDGFYQCHMNNTTSKLRSIFIFSNGARSIDRNWTELTVFHEDLLTICRPVYFNYGFNEEFIELIDTEQTVRYNRSALLIKHIRSTTHLYCKLYLDTTCVGIRVKTLLRKNLDSPLLLDKDLKKNNYLEMNSNERDVYQIAFEGDSAYFHCPSNITLPVKWSYLSYNYYLMKTVPTIYEKDMKIVSVDINDSGMYICQTEEIIYKRIILTILHPPKSPDGIYEHSYHVDFNSKYLICCHLDGVPYPIYSWSMSIQSKQTTFVWCSKRCCWLHVTYKNYDNVICTSANQLGMAKYTVHLIVQDTASNGMIVYDKPKVYNHHINPLDLVRKTSENSSDKASIMTADMESHSSELKNSKENEVNIFYLLSNLIIYTFFMDC